MVMTTIIWALQYYPKTEIDTTGLAEDQVEFSAMRAQQENSYLGQMGHAIEPIFRPAGFDWRIATSILAAFPAREVVVPSMGIIFSVGDDDDVESTPLRTALQEATWPDGRKLFTPYTTVGLMVFFALCAQCMATLAAVKRETNSWKWPVFMFVYMSTLAYLGAVIAYQIGRLNGVG
jgi:ferrous iron transport protein B